MNNTTNPPVPARKGHVGVNLPNGEVAYRRTANHYVAAVVSNDGIWSMHHSEALARAAKAKSRNGHRATVVLVPEQVEAVKAPKAAKPAPAPKPAKATKAPKAKALTGADRAAEAVRLRATGMTLDAIAKALGYASRQSARGAIVRATAA